MKDNITLSSFFPSDREWLSVLLFDKDVRKYLSHLTSDVDKFVRDMEIAKCRGLGALWIVRLEETGVGFISIYDLPENPFVFYAMLPDYRNKGYMKSALMMLEKEIKVPLYTYIDETNVASLNVFLNINV